MLRNEQQRLRRYRRALKDAELPVHWSLIWPASFEMEDTFAVSWFKPTIIPTPNQMKLMRTHHPVTILHVGAVEFVCHILER